MRPLVRSLAKCKCSVFSSLNFSAPSPAVSPHQGRQPRLTPPPLEHGAHTPSAHSYKGLTAGMLIGDQRPTSVGLSSDQTDVRSPTPLRRYRCLPVAVETLILCSVFLLTKNAMSLFKTLFDMHSALEGHGERLHSL